MVIDSQHDLDGRAGGRRRAGARPAAPRRSTCCSWTSGCHGSTASSRPSASSATRGCGLGLAPRIILMTAIDLEEHVPAAAVAGVFAVLYKDVDPEGLFDTVRAAASYRD